MAKIRPRVVLDTNILVSGIVYGGIPQEILLLSLAGEITSISSLVLLTELREVLIKKFSFTQARIEAIQHSLKFQFVITHSHKRLAIVKDEPDNRILEAAVAGKANYIITGDKELLALKKFRSTSIVTPRQFLDSL